jgi:DNA polymerase-3 subunit gamma/tau
LVIVALALYRKYRPATFAEVAGQDHVTEPLRIALGSGRINHAYLFSGPRGCGKTSCARILARSLNCVRGPTADPCGECDSCVALAPEGSGSVDVVELDAASHGGVDDTRELRDRAFFAPAQSRYRIFIIDEAHMVTPQGFNALLKIVEEPPEHLIFVFATTEPDKVLTTIRSRTHHYPFRLMPPGVMRELLERICGEEGVRVEPAVYPLVIRAGGGSARDTLSVLDQLLAGAGEEGVTYERAVALLGVTDVALIDDMVDALAADDAAAVYGTVDRVVEAGHDPRRFASDLLDRLRDLVLLRAVPDAAQRGLIDTAGDELTTMQNEAEQLGAATLSRFSEIVHTGLTEMRGATAPRLLLELLCARMMLPSAAESEAALLQRLERVERRMTIAPPGSGASESEVQAETPAPRGPRREAPRAEPEAQAPEAPQPSEAERGGAEPAEGGAQPGGYDAAAVRRVWTELLRAVAERNRPTQALLLNATVQDLREGTLVLSMPTSGLVKQFVQQHRIDFVRDAMRAVLGGEWEIRCVEAGAAGASGAAKAPARPAPQRHGEQPQRQEEQPRRHTPSDRPSVDNAPSEASNGRTPGSTGRQSERPSAREDVPPPPEPPDDEPPLRDDAPPESAPLEDSEEAVLAESTPGPVRAPRRDTEAAAVELLASELGARKIEDA